MAPPPQKPPAAPVSTETAEEQQSAEDEASAEEEEDEEESDNEGWITPSNLKQAQQDMGHCDTAPVGIQVGCVTTDFAMQVGAGASLRTGGGLGAGSHVTQSWLNQHNETEERVAASLGWGESSFATAPFTRQPQFTHPAFSLLAAERAAADGPPRAGGERAADPPGQELHPALPRLLQVSVCAWSGAALGVGLGAGSCCCAPHPGSSNAPRSGPLLQNHFRHDQGFLSPLR